MNLKNKNILLMGMGKSNLAVAEWLLEQGTKNILIAEEKFLDELPKEDQKKYKKLTQRGMSDQVFMGRFGKHRPDDFIEADLIIKQPSIPDDNRYLKLTEAPIETDISLFSKLCPSKKIIGVTGSKGKTTTATFLYELLKAHGHKAVLGGNMGIPVFDILEQIDKDTWVVLEISSYMAESLAKHKLAPKYVIFTDYFAEHLDHYKTQNDYFKAKTEWLNYQPKGGVLLYNAKLMSMMPGKDGVQLHAYLASSFPESIELKYKGVHYKRNLAAGLIFMSNYLRLDTTVARKVVKDFKIEHRMEYLGEENGREFINNSMAVNPTTFCKDLDVVLEANKPIFMIVGGGDKKLDVMKIVDKINNTDQVIKVAVHAGSAKGRTPMKFIHNLLTDKVVGIYEELEDCFQYLYDESKEGSVIFFNPGFTGFIRGKEFKELVKNVKETKSKNSKK